MNQNSNTFRIITVVLGLAVLAGTAGYVWIRSSSTMVVPPAINTISSNDAVVGTELSIRGSGFTPTRNSLQLLVHEGKLADTSFVYINDLVSPDGKTLTFVLPESFEKCNADKSVCAESVRRPVPGQRYEISVINANGESNRADISIVDWEGSTPTPVPPGPGRQEQVTVTGEIDCLPKKGSGAQTMECAIGLRGADGQYYALKYQDGCDREPRFCVVGVPFVVSGIFSLGAPADSTYDIVGSIEVTSIKEVQDVGNQSGATQN